MIEPRLFTAKETARYLNIGLDTVYKLKNLGQLKFVLPTNDCVRFSKEDLDNFIKSKTVASAEDEIKLKDGRRNGKT